MLFRSSIIALQLEVSPEYDIYDNRAVMVTDLPMQYRDTVFGTETPVGKHTFIFNRQSVAGCDSTTTLILEVKDTLPDGLNDLYDLNLDIYPNPVQRTGEVIIDGNFTESEMDGIIVEVFNSAGERVKYLRPEAIPTKIQGFDASGVYIVRITTNTNRVIHGKSVVK